MGLAHLDVMFASILCTAVTNYRCLSGETFFFRDPDYQTHIVPQCTTAGWDKDAARCLSEDPHVENA
jgi:hypothetical protein